MASDRGMGVDSRRAWVAATAALAILVVAHGAPLVSVVALKVIAQDLGTSRGGPSAVPALVYVGAAVGGILAGWLAGRLGARRVVLFGGVMIAAGLFVSSLGGLSTLYVGHGLLIGLFGASCMMSPLLTYVSLWFERQRGQAVALISSGQSLAGVIWPMLLETMIADHGWRLTMRVAAVVALVLVTLLAVLFLHAPPEMASGPVAQARGEDGRTQVLGLPPNVVMVLLMLAVVCCCIPMAMPLQHVVAFCGDLGLQRGAAMLSVLLGFAFVARQFWGWMSDRIGGLKTLLWSALAQVITLSGFLMTRDEALLFAVSAAFGFAFSGLLPAYVIAIRELFPAREASWRVPVWAFAGYIGMAAGGWGAGLLYDAYGYYGAAFGIGLLVNQLNVAILAFLIYRQSRRDDRPLGQPA